MTECLSRSEQEFLDAFSGTGPNRVAALRAVSETTGAAEAMITSALTIDEAGSTLDLDLVEVTRLAVEGDIYWFIPNGDRQPLCPSWQFAGDRLVPHIKVVVEALGPVSPLVVQAFFTAAAVEASDRDDPVPVVDWLLSGGSVAPVVALALAYVCG